MFVRILKLILSFKAKISIRYSLTNTTSSYSRHVPSTVKLPSMDTNNLILKGSVTDPGKLSYSFYRLLNTGDDDDLDLTDEKFYLMFAHGQADGQTMSYHGPQYRHISPEMYCLSQTCGEYSIE